MNNPVIQFGSLEQFIQEPFVPGQVVRVVVLDMAESTTSQIPDLRQVTVGVHVRTINNDGRILACYLPVGTVQLYNGRREGDPTWQRYDTLREEAEAVKAHLMACLQAEAAGKGFVVRPDGVIDLGEVRPLPGKWTEQETSA